MSAAWKTRIEVVKVDAMPAARLWGKWLPVRNAPAGLATQGSQRLVAPGVLGCVFRVSLDQDRSKFVVRPDSVEPPAQGAVAARAVSGTAGNVMRTAPQ